MLAGVAGAMFANWMTRNYCKVTVMKWASVALVLVYTALAFVPRDQYMLALALTVGSNFVHMIIIPYLFSAVADTVDYGIQRWGKGAMAMSYSGHLLALKIGIAMGGALSGWILAYVGYQPNVAQTETALSGIVFLYAWTSAIAGILLIVCFSFYRLNRKWAQQKDLLAREAI
jgi:glycoside/pentoside/hexuronide:cation symporter, GPH family